MKLIRSARFPERAFVLLLFIALGVSAALAATEQVLHSFKGRMDGEVPYAGLVADSSGNLYGTTYQGGGSGSCNSGCGTVFQLSPPATSGGAWTERILYSFRGGSDGANPYAPLIFDKSGNLFGSTTKGGDGKCSNLNELGCGTVFELSPPSGKRTTWVYRQLYSFQGVPTGQGNGDGALPAGLAMGKDGNLYGLAYEGGNCKTDETGTSCGGAAFKLVGSGGKWSESIIFRFTGPYFPFAGPVFDAAGNIYGGGPGGLYGAGAIWRLQPTQSGTWMQAGIYDFHGTSDGALPNFGLVFDVAGNLYGTSTGFASGFDNVFEVSPTQDGEWTETVLYNFTPISTGYLPESGPILGPGGRLYGTTAAGGEFGYGTVYGLVPPAQQGGSWAESVLYSFSPSTDGFAPAGGLTLGKDGALYGTTPAGGDMTCGTSGNGCGTVFRIVP